MKYIYVCGPTVYNHPHIGNLRPIVSFDIFIRSLRYLNEKVFFIHNITDIDDKIILAAQNEKLTEKEISHKYFLAYEKLLKDINVDTIDKMPFVTLELKEMIDFINELIIQKKAYIENGSVYFKINKSENYGEISNQNNDLLISQKNNFKINSNDFVLWKNTKKGIQFDSPWSKGRPGWHTECAFFIYKYAKKNQLFFHGGGIDLIFPHHENENAQFKSLLEQGIAKHWKHVGQVNVNNQKMSKSLNNFWLAEDFFQKYEPDFLRFLFLSSGVTSPLSIDKQTLENSLISFNRLKKYFLKSQILAKSIKIDEFAQNIAKWKFANALKLINFYIKEFNINKNKKNASYINSAMKLIGFNFAKVDLTEDEKHLYRDWEKARKNKNFQLADKLRKELMKIGII